MYSEESINQEEKMSAEKVQAVVASLETTDKLTDKTEATFAQNTEFEEFASVIRENQDVNVGEVDNINEQEFQPSKVWNVNSRFMQLFNSDKSLDENSERLSVIEKFYFLLSENERGASIFEATTIECKVSTCMVAVSIGKGWSEKEARTALLEVFREMNRGGLTFHAWEYVKLGDGIYRVYILRKMSDRDD